MGTNAQQSGTSPKEQKEVTITTDDIEKKRISVDMEKPTVITIKPIEHELS